MGMLGSRIARWSTVVIAAGCIGAAPASAGELHMISEAQANRVADHFGLGAYTGSPWAEEWGYECERETPWTFGCFIELWTDKAGGPECWREFKVASSAWNGRLRTEEWTSWECDPWPVGG